MHGDCLTRLRLGAGKAARAATWGICESLIEWDFSKSLCLPERLHLGKSPETLRRCKLPFKKTLNPEQDVSGETLVFWALRVRNSSALLHTGPRGEVRNPASSYSQSRPFLHSVTRQQKWWQLFGAGVVPAVFLTAILAGESIPSEGSGLVEDHLPPFHFMPLWLNGLVRDITWEVIDALVPSSCLCILEWIQKEGRRRRVSN